ncbi:ShlB/FhaC/HecB family hemolysin secretion/activation protein [Luteimonas chenhongjianii]|nr:ShlB/FhaC/HecB family hemolysin secretion/activation protein [Luteimonas chenhongjianii]
MYRSALLICSLLLPGMAHGQSSRGGQDASQRIDGYYEQRQPLQSQQPVQDPLQSAPPPDADAAPGQGGGSFMLEQVDFTPSVLLPPATLDAIAARYTGREVHLAELDALIAEVNGAYEAAGINTARALLREQSIESGRVEVTLMEGRLGRLEISGEGGVPARFIEKRVSQPEGEVVNSARLRDELVYLNRTTDMQVRALLRPGEAPGQTDIMLVADVPEPRSWGVFVDNSGVESTGRERYGAQGQFWGLAGISDLLAGSVAWSRGGLEGRVGYSGIVNARNGRLGLNVSRSQINIIDGAFRNLDITGQSTSYGLDYTQPWVATPNWLLSTVASLSRSNSESEIASVRVSEIDSTTLTLGITAGYRNDGYEWNLYQGVSRVRTDETLAEGRGFTIANGSTSWTQRIGGTGLLYRAQLGWQFASGEFLPASNLFQIGGIGSVRGYVRGALSGVEGYFGSIELHRPYRQAHDVYLFFDHGEVRGDFPASASMSSVGVGLNGQFATRYSYSLDLGHPLDRVLEDHDSLRADFRVSARW